LIVDDNADLRLLTRLSIEETNCEVVGEARDGAEAIALAEDLRPDVVLMDMKMPVMDGVEATKTLKFRFPDLEIIIFSASDDPIAHDQMLEAGADGSVNKGNLDELVIRLSS
jgi:CheY-like chemotaxis protein